MKRNVFLMGVAVLGVAALAWMTAALAAPRGGGHAARAAHVGHARGAAHVGSVHYGGRVNHAPVGPAVHGAVRSEHYAHPGFHAGGPYREEYFRHFRPGGHALWLGGVPYSYYDGLPPGCQPVVIGTVTYYVLDGVYYEPYFYGGRTVYLVVPPPG